MAYVPSPMFTHQLEKFQIKLRCVCMIAARALNTLDAADTRDSEAPRHAWLVSLFFSLFFVLFFSFPPCVDKPTHHSR